MRQTPMIVVGALLLVSAASAQAQQQTPAPQTAAQQQATPASSFTPKLGAFDFGFRFEDLDGDPARYQRFRDLRQGPVVGFRLNKETDTWVFASTASNIGYRDQLIAASFQNIGKLKADFEWNQVPLFSAEDQRTLYRDAGNGELRIDDAIQASLQGAANPAARDALLNAAFAGAGSADLRSRRDTGTLNLAYSVNRDVDVKFNVRNTMRTGNQVFSYGFGTSPGLNPAVEIGVPLDDRTTDINGSIEFANAKGLLSLGYTGSWFSQDVPFVRFDNPLRAADINNGPSQGQAAWWPTNSSFAVNANGAYTLARRTRANVGISIGRWSQDEALPPATVNTALTDSTLGPHLARTNADTQADIKSIVLNLNSRPTNMLWFNAKYRFYDYANKTPAFESVNAVIGDWGYGTQIHETEPSSFSRGTLDLDASFSPLAFASFNVGFSREDNRNYIHDDVGFHNADIKAFRIFEDTAENTLRLSADSIGNQYASVRVKYERSTREGEGFNQHLLDEVSEQPTTRHYDIANRDRDRFTTMLSITPMAQFAVNASVSMGRDDYEDTGFGLRDNENDAWGVGFDVYPLETVSFGLNYARETYKANQASRTSNPLPSPTFDDPTRNWTLDQDDTVNTFSVNLDLLQALRNTDIRFSYDLSDGEATYVYGGPATTNPTVFTTTPLRQLMPVTNKLTDFRADVRHMIRQNIALGLTYWYEQYKVQDFSMSPETINAPNPVNATTGVFASTIYSGYLYRPYTGNNFTLRMTYLW